MSGFDGAVAYYRVSTKAQGASGLGLDAQREAVASLCRLRSLRILAEFTEVESGKSSIRLQLDAALRHARLTGAILVIAKLDRLSRNAAFLLALREGAVRFQAADLPNANDLTIGVMAVVAQAEREAIAARTREALGQIRTRLAAGEEYVSRRSGRALTRLGNPDGAAALRGHPGVSLAASAALRAGADEFASDLRGALDQFRKDGCRSFGEYADALNRASIQSRRGGGWHPSSVRNLMLRLQFERLGAGSVV